MGAGALPGSERLRCRGGAAVEVAAAEVVLPAGGRRLLVLRDLVARAGGASPRACGARGSRGGRPDGPAGSTERDGLLPGRVLLADTAEGGNA